MIPEITLDQEDTFATIIRIVEESKRKPFKNSRVQSFSPVAKGKDSFGLYYDQQSPDSSENRIRTKPMAYFSKKNLRDYKINNGSRDNKLKNSVPIYNPSKITLSSSSSKGVLTTANFSNNDKKEYQGKKKSHVMKWNSSQIKYKSKKGNDSTLKSPHSKYTTSYSSKRPKSAKGGGLGSKGEYTYKYSYKGSGSSKYTSSSKKRNDTSSQLRKNHGIKDITSKKKDYPSSFRKSNISGTHKKYAKTSRGGKKSNNSNSRLLEQGSNTCSTSKFNTKAQKQSYNSIMTMLMSKDKDMYRTTNDAKTMKHKQTKDQGYHFKNSGSSSNSKLFGTNTRKTMEANVYKASKDTRSYKKSSVNLYTNKAGEKEMKKELEEYLKSNRSRGSRNYMSHHSNAHVAKTHQ